MIRVTPRRVKIAVSVPTSSGKTAVGASALPSVFAFGVFAHDDPVEIAALAVRARGMTNLAGCASAED